MDTCNMITLQPATTHKSHKNTHLNFPGMVCEDQYQHAMIPYILGFGCIWVISEQTLTLGAGKHMQCNHPAILYHQ